MRSPSAGSGSWPSSGSAGAKRTRHGRGAGSSAAAPASESCWPESSDTSSPGVALEDGADPFEAWSTFISELGIDLGEEGTRSASENPEGRGPRLFFQIVPEDKVGKNRVHLDVRAAPGVEGEPRMEALESESLRLGSLGATRLRRVDPAPPMEAGFIVMADPEGNEFCLD